MIRDVGRKRIGKRIKNMRLGLALTCESLALWSNVSRPTLQKIEEGREAKIEHINRVLEAFDMHVELIIRKND